MNKCQYIISVGIHLTNTGHTEFRKYEKPGPNEQLVDIMGSIVEWGGGERGDSPEYPKSEITIIKML